MPLRLNPFRKQDENVRPLSNGVDSKTANGNQSQPIVIRQKYDATEYKLSEINDSGVFVPPSPPEERKSFWTASSSIRSTASSGGHRSLWDENEPFNISRESFDSYRRSFDISARSPIIQAAENCRPPRASLDSRTFMPPRQSNSFNRPLQVPGTQKEEEPALEDVSLDEPKTQPQKKRGMFSRIIDSGDSHAERPTSHANDTKDNRASWHHFGGRKRGQSGQGAELGNLPKREETPKPDSQLKNEQKRESMVAQAQGPGLAPAVAAPAPAPPQPPAPDSAQKQDRNQSQAKAGAENPQAPVASGTS